MRNPETVLENLKSHATSPDYQYKRLYRTLYNPSFYLLAYQQTYSKPGNMSKGIDGQTFDGMSLKRIEKIIASLKDHSYQPKPARRTYIPKKNGKLRPLGVPSSDDKLIQQVIKMLLESIYEDTFSVNSHGFRPGRSCHTTLSQIKFNFTGVKWFVEGDIKGYFDNIDHHILIGILRRRIKDEYFISLLWKFLRAGYVENRTHYKPDKGLHQGSLISPILANVYLNEFDHYMEEFKTTFDRSQKRKRAPEYNHIQNKEQRLREKISKLPCFSIEKTNAMRNLKQLRNLRVSMSCGDPMDSAYKRVFYQRYADDFIIGIIGSKQDAKQIKNEVSNFLAEQLHLELSQDKTLITHGKDKAHFLGYDITIGRKATPSKDKLGKLSDRHNGRVKLYLPQEAWLKKLKMYEAIKIINQTGSSEKWKPCARPNLMYFPDHEIVRIYNREIQGLYQYYKFADNVSVLNDFYFIMKYSLLKTLAGKHNSSVHKVLRKYSHDGRFRINFSAKGRLKTIYLYDYGFRKRPIIKNSSTKHQSNELTNRLLSRKCEWCGCADTNVSTHQVRKLTELSGVTIWEQKMLALNRKTLVLCPACHDKLHKGILD
jgi:group II intron reverse transcriptase/maturase